MIARNARNQASSAGRFVQPRQYRIRPVSATTTNTYSEETNNPSRVVSVGITSRENRWPSDWIDMRQSVAIRFPATLATQLCEDWYVGAPGVYANQKRKNRGQSVLIEPIHSPGSVKRTNSAASRSARLR